MKSPIVIDYASSIPKYQQIFQSVINLIERRALKRGDSLPSINELSESQKIAKVTVAKAYKMLKQNGLVRSKQGKGFYIASTEISTPYNIFLLFDTFNAYKETLYYSFKEAVPEHSQLSLFFHHYDLGLFESLINNNIGNHHYYVIMPHFNDDVTSIVKKIPSNELIVLDKAIDSLDEGYATVYQDFEQDIFSALQAAGDLLLPYQKLTCIKSTDHFQFIPEGILRGFDRFKNSGLICCEIAENFSPDLVKAGEAYLFFADRDLIAFIKETHRLGLRLGKDVGLISYDDTPVKEILEGGITVISTDFEQMGKTAGEFVEKKIKGKIANPARLIVRKSL